MTWLRNIPAEWSPEDKARWCIVRLDTMQLLPGLVFSADVEAGKAQMRERNGDNWRDVAYDLGPRGIAIRGS